MPVEDVRRWSWLAVVFGSPFAACTADAVDDPAPLAPGVTRPRGDPAPLIQEGPRACNGEAVRYVDATLEAGIGYEAWVPDVLPDGSTGYNSVDLETLGGMALADFDGDGALDLIVSDGERAPRYFGGLGDGRFQQRTLSALGLPGDGIYLHGLSAADWDGDKDPDLAFADRGSDRFFRNDAGFFVDVSELFGVPDGDRRSLSISWADFDQDEDLDAYVARYGDGVVGESLENEVHNDSLWVARPEGRFQDHIEWVHQPGADGYGFIGGWFDADLDGWLDLYVVNDLGEVPDDGPDNWFRRNTGQGDEVFWTFESQPTRGLDRAMLSMGLAIGDLDADGDADVHVSNAGTTFLARNDGAAGFVDVSVLLPERDPDLGDISWGTEFFDHDNDGLQELFVAYGHMPSKETGRGPSQTLNQEAQYDRLYGLDADGTWVDLAPDLGIDDPGPTRTVIPADIDGNGFLDLLTWRIGEGPRLWLAECNPNQWLSVRLDQPFTKNRDAIGARVEAWDGDVLVAWNEVRVGSTGTQSSGPPVVHLGLGERTRVDLAVHWPGGPVTVNEGVETAQRIELQRP